MRALLVSNDLRCFRSFTHEVVKQARKPMINHFITLPFHSMKHILLSLFLFPIILNAQVEATESDYSAGFKHQTGGQIGLLGVFAYMERSIGLSWTYRLDIGYGFQGHGPLQDETGFSSRLVPETSIEIRRYWKARKEGRSTFVSLKAKRLSDRSIMVSGSSEVLSSTNQLSTSLLVGRNMNIKAHGRMELGCGLDLLHLPSDFFKITFAPTVHLRLGLGW